jgi:hypothetical protein
MRNWPLVLAAVASVLGAGRARAEGKRTSSLAWVRLEGADECIAATALAHAVEERLARKVFVSASDADITVEGSIGPARPSGFHASLRVIGRSGEILGTREVDTRAARCDAIDTRLALVVSMLIDPDAENAPEPPAAPPPAPTVVERVVERERVVVVREAPAAPPPAPWTFELTAGGAGTLGLQPGVGAALGAALVVLPPRFWGIFVGGALAQTSSVDAERGAQIEAALAYGAAGLCPLAATRGRLHVLGCAGALVGGLRSRGVGFETGYAASSLTAGPLLHGRITVEVVGPVIASLGLGLTAPVARAELRYATPTGESTVFRTSPVAAAGELGVGVRLP